MHNTQRNRRPFHLLLAAWIIFKPPFTLFQRFEEERLALQLRTSVVPTDFRSIVDSVVFPL